MPKRLRLLIYEGTEAQLDHQLSNGLFGKTTGTKVLPPGPFREGMQQLTVTAIDLDPTQITLREVWRVLRRESKRQRAVRSTRWDRIMDAGGYLLLGLIHGLLYPLVFMPVFFMGESLRNTHRFTREILQDNITYTPRAKRWKDLQ